MPSSDGDIFYIFADDMKSNTKKTILVAAAAITIIIAAAGIYTYRYISQPFDGKKVRVYVPETATSESLRDSLVSTLGDSYGSAVYHLWHLQGGESAKAHGSYVVDPGASALSVSRRIKYGRQSPVNLTFNNIRTIDALARRIASRMEFDAAGFMAACDSILPGMGFKPAQYPAAFLPDTYQFYWTDSATDVVAGIASVRNEFWNETRRARAKTMGLTPVEVATVASIVEEETAKSDERPLVARLYLNRVSKGMKLQADPTVKFALGDFSLRRLYNKHLTVDSPYNTYRNAGLPPGPIRIAERSAITAVLDAPQHDYIYMCAKEDFSGYHNFAADYAGHQANARRYRQALDKRNIR